MFNVISFLSFRGSWLVTLMSQPKIELCLVCKSAIDWVIKRSWQNGLKFNQLQQLV